MVLSRPQANLQDMLSFQSQYGNLSNSEPPSLADYSTQAREADELLALDGSVRPHWLPLLGALTAEGGALHEVGRATRRLVDELGVTYHVYSDPAGVQRPWPLDAIPHLLQAQEWTLIQAAVEQRARLFEWILQDIYGPRQLLAEGLVPPEFLSAHNGFFPILRGTLDSETPALTLYAADLARGREGGFWVIGDRTQAPSGAGYAFQNREILSRTWPHTFRELGVRGFGAFFDRLREHLAGLMPGVPEPRIVLLSPGPLNEAWYEHVLLARQLGLLLVQGQDLVFRDGFIWLSTLNGLERVHVVLRRVDDAWCDPLSFDSASRLGVAGLVESVRQKKVVVANALGSALLESPGWPAFLPSIAQYVLGEPLLLPSVTTWWCGQPEGLERVLDTMEATVVRSIDRREGGRPIFVEALDPDERNRLRMRIAEDPTRFVGQERIGISTMPCFGERGRIEPRHGTVRIFSTLGCDGIFTLAGGLCRVAGESGTQLVSNQEGGVSKDTWVLREESFPAVAEGSLSEYEPGIVEPDSLPRRVADNLLWSGRYAERSEGLIRWLRLVLRRIRINRFERRTIDETTTAMLQALTHLTATYPGFVDDEESESRLLYPESELLNLLTDPARSGTVPSVSLGLLTTVNALRDRLSAESVRVASGIREVTQSLAELRDPVEAEGKLEAMTLHLLALVGLSHESILRHDGWRFLDSGRRLERALQLLSLLRSTVVYRRQGPHEQLLNDMVLVFSESLSVYRSRPMSERNTSGLLDLVLLEPQNPRALIFQLDRLIEHCEELPRPGNSGRIPEYLRNLEQARWELRLSRQEDWMNTQNDIRTELDDFLSRQQKHLTLAYDALFAQILAPVPSISLSAETSRIGIA